MRLTNGFCPSGCKLQLWHSNATSHFTQLRTDIAVPPESSGDQSVELALASGSIYTLSTITTATKGSHGAIPPRTAFPSPYSQSFEGLANDTLAPYFCDQSGSFSVEVGAGRGGGSALKQRVTRDPTVGNSWIFDQDPVTIIGSHNWTSYSLAADFSLVKTPVDTTETTPTAAALLPCTDPAMDAWSFDECDASGAGRVSQGIGSASGGAGTCLGAAGCDATKLSLLPCDDPKTPPRCLLFEVKGKQLVHKASGMCAASVTQLSVAAAPRARGRVGAESRTREQEHVARLAPCVAGAASQAWTNQSSQLQNQVGGCLSTKARRASVAPPYGSLL